MKKVSWLSTVVLLVLCVALCGCKPNVAVPDLTGMTQAAAATALADVKLVVGTVTEAYSATVAAGLVISQTPAAGEKIKQGSAVELVISKGPEPVAVPNVVGQTQAAATTSLTGAGLTLGAVTQSFSATVASGNVISQTPAAGTSVAPGSAVALEVSKGPAPVTVSVPNVVGQTQAAATTSITGAGLVLGTVTQAFSNTVASGTVMSQTPTAGTSVASGSAVNLVVSKGPQFVTVPNVVGQAQAAASTAITGAGLTVGAITEVFSATVAVGVVISQTPVAASSVIPGSAVALEVSKGPEPVTVAVPNVVGQVQSVAEAAIVAAGLSVGSVTEVFSETVPSGSVVSETPAAATLVNPGSTVDLAVSKGPQPISVPNVVGLTEAAAGTALTNALLMVGAVTDVYNGVVAPGLVISQLPAAGMSVSAGTAVDLSVSKGPEFVQVPNVVGQTLAQATLNINNALLSLGAVNSMYTGPIGTPVAGQVTAQDPVADTTVGQHTAVNLDVLFPPLTR